MSALDEPDKNIPQPVSVPPDQVDLAYVSHPKKSLLIWVRVSVDDGTERTERGFALAWTKAHVLVQVQWQADYYGGAREFWVEAERVKQRVFERGGSNGDSTRREV